MLNKVLKKFPGKWSPLPPPELLRDVDGRGGGGRRGVRRCAGGDEGIVHRVGLDLQRRRHQVEESRENKREVALQDGFKKGSVRLNSFF